MITNYGNAYSSILIEIQGMLGIPPNEHIELTRRMFELAFAELRENIFWASPGAHKIFNFTLKAKEKVGGGHKFNECNKRIPAFDINLTLYKDFKVLSLIDESDDSILKESSSLKEMTLYSYLLVEHDSCKEIFIKRNREKKYTIEFITAGVVTCSEKADDVLVGLDSLAREFLIYESALKLSVRLNMDLGKNFELQYRKIKDRLIGKTKVTARSTWSQIPI